MAYAYVPPEAPEVVDPFGLREEFGSDLRLRIEGGIAHLEILNSKLAEAADGEACVIGRYALPAHAVEGLMQPPEKLCMRLCDKRARPLT